MGSSPLSYSQRSWFVLGIEDDDLPAGAYAKGFLLVSATPLTRSSHHAGDDFARLRAARRERTGS